MEERLKRKWRKFRNRVPAPEKWRDKNPLLSNNIKNALNKTKSNETNETIFKNRNKKLRGIAMEFTNSGIPLLNDNNDKHCSSSSVNERKQLLGNELGQNQSACVSSAVDSLVDLDNGSSMERDELVGKGKKTSEAHSSFNDSVLQNADLSLGNPSVFTKRK